MDKTFDYVVAKPWDPEDPKDLCIYTYFSEIQNGTMKDAKRFLKYVRGVNKEDAKEYSIYKVEFTKI